MSPFDEVTTIEMSPSLEVSTGGQIWKDSDELQGIATSRGTGASEKRRTETGKRRSDDGAELSPDEAVGQALSRSGSQRAETRERGAGVEPKEAAEIPGTSVAVSGQEVFRGGRKAVRADVSGRALGERRSCGSECADPAALDVVRGAMESCAEAACASQAARTERACGGTGADGWKFPRLVGGARAAGLFDEHGGRRQRRYAGTHGE